MFLHGQFRSGPLCPQDVQVCLHNYPLISKFTYKNRILSSKTRERSNKQLQLIRHTTLYLNLLINLIRLE